MSVFECNTIKKRGQITSSTLLRYRQTPLHHIRVKAHVKHVSIRALLLTVSSIGDLGNKNQSGRFFQYVRPVVSSCKPSKGHGKYTKIL